jgi:hypothetical protein
MTFIGSRKKRLPAAIAVDFYEECLLNISACPAETLSIFWTRYTCEKNPPDGAVFLRLILNDEKQNPCVKRA